MPDIVYLRDVVPRARVFSAWERHRHSSAHWLVECFAEFLGVFFYTYAGVGSTASFVVGNILQEPGFGSLLQVGFGYAMGICLALAVCSATSGGHFNPCVSITFVLLRGFPPLKALRYIVAQILGAYVACLLVYAQYSDLIKTAETLLAASGKLSAVEFTSLGPAGIFALYAPAGAHLGKTFLNEFITDTFLALAIFACIDPTNILVPPPAAPFVIALAYAAAIWGFGIPGLAANAARDVGGRLSAITIWGRVAAGDSKYAAIAALTNIPATLFGGILYELFMTDSDRVMPRAQREFMDIHHYHGRNEHVKENGDRAFSEKRETESA